MDAAPLLRRLPIFSELDPVTLRQLAARCVSRSVPSGTVLFTAGETCRGLYVVERGRVRIYRTSPDGKEQVLHIEGAGRAVAELPLFDGGVYPASAVTIEASRLVFLLRADLEQLYRSSPDVAHAIICGLGKRLRHLVQVAQTLAFRDVAARLALLLANEAEQHGEFTQSGVELALGRTQEALALEIGTARESVSRAMRQLKRSGVIQTLGGTRLRIPDVDRLRAVAYGA